MLSARGTALDIPQAYEAGFCEGFIAGLALGEHPPSRCLPPEVGLPQMEAVYMHWADQHPEQWHLPGNATVILALAEAFPCKQ
jgi:hypothetical protein